MARTDRVEWTRDVSQGIAPPSGDQANETGVEDPAPPIRVDGADRVRHRPRGTLRRVGTMISPSAAAAGQIALERDAKPRVNRLVAAAKERVKERRNPTRPTMRALIASGRCRLEWRDIPAPETPGLDAAVVAPVAVATCDLDRSLALGATPFPLGFTIGHECVAEVLCVGERVNTVRPGELVVVPFEINCGKCGPCRAGHTSNCAGVPPISMYGFGVGGGHWGGALADKVAVPYADAMLVPLPAGVSPVAAASTADTICDAYRHIAPHLPRLLAQDPGTEVLIVACLGGKTLFSPSVPLYAGQIALAMGAPKVRLVDRRPEVRAAAAQLGFEALTPDELRKTPPAGLVVSATATAKGVWAALSATAPDGICSCVGGLHRTARIPVTRLYGRNVTFHIGRTDVRALLPEVLELIAGGRFQPERVVTTLGPIDDAPRLLARHYRTGDFKTILTRDA